MGPLEKAARAICKMEMDDMRTSGKLLNKGDGPDTLCRLISSPGPRGTEIVSSSYAAIQATLAPVPAWVFYVGAASVALDAVGVVYDEESEFGQFKKVA